MSFTLFTNWAVGVINGYKQKENGLPNNIKYGTIGLSTFMTMFKTLGYLDTPVYKKFISATTPGQKLAGLFIGIPLIMGTNFCVGHHMGKAIRYAEDDSRSSNNGVRIKLL
jgi:hypothetical protein